MTYKDSNYYAYFQERFLEKHPHVKREASNPALNAQDVTLMQSEGQSRADIIARALEEEAIRFGFGASATDKLVMAYAADSEQELKEMLFENEQSRNRMLLNPGIDEVGIDKFIDKVKRFGILRRS